MPKTLVMPINDPGAIPAAVKIVQEGGLIAFPTDTVYGVAADPFNAKALQKIYAAKQRPDEKALPALIGGLEQLGQLVGTVDHSVYKVALTFWPGALTLILPKRADVPEELSPYPTIGIRMPNLAFTLALLKQTGPLATTSANRSGASNPTTAEDVLDQLGGEIDLVLDGGPTAGSMASTVVDLTEPEIKILREGPISLAEIQKCIFEE
ncbi:MAG: threonylcarbamoyl-AMP synthase [Anaerolineaceae bacterium]|jgi:L-threonylcarbamoyladenylate synthase|nr:threonylcarbamoyl-AMP synthase [Anaerolineaceae bacterium]